MTERWFPDEMPWPAASADTLGWWEAAAERRLVVQRCRDCKAFRSPPGPMCPTCRSFESVWHEVPGRGTVVSYTAVHQIFFPTLADVVPFNVSVIELEGADGTRVISNVVGCPPGEVRAGLAVEVVWEELSGSLALPRFRPAP